MNDDERAALKIHDAIVGQREALGKTEGEVLATWILVSEWISPDGGLMLNYAHSEDCPPWKAKGMALEVLTDGFTEP